MNQYQRQRAEIERLKKYNADWQADCAAKDTRIRELEQTLSGKSWSVNFALPGHGVWVLCLDCYGYVWKAKIGVGDFGMTRWIASDNYSTLKGVIRWMPMPVFIDKGDDGDKCKAAGGTICPAMGGRG